MDYKTSRRALFATMFLWDQWCITQNYLTRQSLTNVGLGVEILPPGPNLILVCGMSSCVYFGWELTMLNWNSIVLATKMAYIVRICFFSHHKQLGWYITLFRLDFLKLHGRTFHIDGLQCQKHISRIPSWLKSTNNPLDIFGSGILKRHAVMWF